jgi:hypothetical protein
VGASARRSLRDRDPGTGSSAEAAGVPTWWLPIRPLVQAGTAGLRGAGGAGVGQAWFGEVPFGAEGSHHVGHGGALACLLIGSPLPGVSADALGRLADLLLELAERGQRLVELFGGVGEVPAQF